jgi:hypothetical protein
MSNRLKPKSPSGTAKGEARPNFPITWFAIAGSVAVLVLGIWVLRPHPETAPTPASGGSPVADTNLQSALPAGRTPTASPQFQKLLGRWRRPDGGYILDFRGVDASGQMQAAYFNPQQINVHRAVAVREGSAVKVFVELRDVNYPGSTYTLVLDSAKDQLQGIYYQAALNQQYEVIFERAE